MLWKMFHSMFVIYGSCWMSESPISACSSVSALLLTGIIKSTREDAGCIMMQTSPCQVNKIGTVFFALQMSVSETSRPIVLLLGEIYHARTEWDALSTLGELRVS